MLPKQKKFVEKCFEAGIIDTVVGTDALAMGVNFPIENVVFAQLSKKEGCISKNLFEQLAGRAGRKGYFNEGHVFYTDIIDNDLRRDYERENMYGKDNYDWKPIHNLYFDLLFSKNEDVSVQLMPSIKKILAGDKDIDEEAEYIVKYSTNKTDINTIISQIQELVDIVKNYQVVAHSMMREHDDFGYYDRLETYNYDDKAWIEQSQKIDSNKESDGIEELNGTSGVDYADIAMQQLFEEDICNVYSEYFTPLQNCKVFSDILLGRSIPEILSDNKLYGIRGELTLRKYLHQLPSKYRKIVDLNELDEMIYRTDSTVFDEIRGRLMTREISLGTFKLKNDRTAMTDAMQVFVQEDKSHNIEQARLELLAGVIAKIKEKEEKLLEIEYLDDMFLRHKGVSPNERAYYRKCDLKEHKFERDERK